MIAALIAAAMTFAGPAVPPPRPVRPDARPALWVVNDHDTVIYLFGTFHALDGRSAWFNDEVKTAFVGSDQLILETVVPGSAIPAAGSDRRPARSFGALEPVAGSTSHLSTSKMVMSAGRARGMSTDKGADSVLRRAAEDAGKPVGALESFDDQLKLFGSLPASSTPIDPEQSAAVKAALGELLDRLQAAWNRGDIESFAPMLEQMRANSPQMYKLMFADRNTRWAGWIANRLHQPGVVFVAVGAGHLAGQDSVQQKLAEMRIRSERLN